LKAKASQGLIKYIIRHYLGSEPNDEIPKLRLSGYGVELQIKSSEYKSGDDRKVNDDGQELGNADQDNTGEDKSNEINGFNFKILSEKNPKDQEKLSEFKQFLLDENDIMAPMKVWQMQDLSLQTAARVLNSPKEQQLSNLVELSQNFPSYARPLSKTSVPKDLKKEVKKNREIFFEKMSVQPSDAALFINGLYFDMDYVDIFTILETIKSEAKVLDGLGRLGLSDEIASKLTSVDFSNSNKLSYGIDVRDTAVNWINDLEKDKMYQGWPEGVMEMLRPTFPGMMRSVRKNFFNLVMICDPSKAKCRPLIKMLESFYLHRAPTRIGIIFAVNPDLDEATGENDAGVAMLNAYNYVHSLHSSTDALAFITSCYSKVDDEGQDIPVEEIINNFKAQYGLDKAEGVFEAESEYDVGRTLAKDFLDRSGLNLDSLPQVLMNGVPMEEKNLNGEDFEEALMMSIMKETTVVQKAIYRNQMTDEDECLDYLMKQPHIMPRLNDRILKDEDSVFLDYTGESLPSLKLEHFAALNSKELLSATLAKHIQYINSHKDEKKLHVLTVWAVVDLESPKGLEIVRGALSQLKSSNQVRVALVYNSEKPDIATRVAKAAFDSQTNNLGIRNLLGKLLKDDTLKNLKIGTKKLEDFEIPGADMEAFIKVFNDLKEDDEMFDIHKIFVEKVLGFTNGQNGILLNGRIIGPFGEKETFGDDDFNLLDKFSMAGFGEKLVNTLYTHFEVTKHEGISDLAMKLSSLLVSRPESKTRHEISFSSDKQSVIKLDPEDSTRPSFDLVAIIDPLSKGAQKITPTLLALSKVVNSKIRIFLNCVEKHSELPQKSYFRLVLEPELTFTSKGEFSSGPIAKFNNLPEEPIFTMHHHIPDNWLIEPVNSIYDLDNIKLASVEGDVVHSEFELENLLLEGHCFEAYTGNPPRGLQLSLGTKQVENVMDTIVMANLGYLQLKSSPGRWLLKLRQGRSNELYDIASIDGKETQANEELPILISSFQSKIVKLRVAKKPDKRDEELLQSEDKSDSSGGLWNSITSTLGVEKLLKNDADSDEPLNIFCLASGHLYERLLKIMILSVKRTTQAPVKFWILKSYLSPTLKDFLPYYAEKYGFEYEYVQYKWPRWLNQQTEKQRIIWGYKILFLDVMFPLHVKKIIFVDTDQIVRADLTELRDMDLKGAPYGYTPMGDSNKDMEGFRFWKQGYWKNHLAGRKYHISALYVVDLVKFRQIAAGDRLRGQYQALSQDPNSLSNLDQDLPNNMIHQVPIFSLPQEWLYCETWCDKSELPQAKSIDLCNNPQTKEPKLTAARRIVKEWSAYDDEMTKLAEEIRLNASEKSGKTSVDHQHTHTEL